MSTLKHPQIVTANDLLDGMTVYLNPAGRWVGDYRVAQVATTQEAADALLADAVSDASVVVGPRLIDVALLDLGVPYPRDFRERARVIGPSVGPVRLAG